MILEPLPAVQAKQENGQSAAQTTRWAAWIAWVAAALAFCLYAWASAPSIVEFFDDTLEFQLVLPTFGIAHPTGYPLYVIMGGLWSRLLPLGEWAGRANLFSALCAAATLGLVTALAMRLASLPEHSFVPRPALWAGPVAAAAFAFGRTWTAQATVAEVYALHGLFVALILLLALRATAQQDPVHSRTLTVLFLVTGLALAHHRTTLLVLPGLAIYLIWSIPAILRPRRAWFVWSAAFLAPLLLYLYLPLRSAMGVNDLNGAYVQSWSGFWVHVLARNYGAFFTETALSVNRVPGEWLALAVREMGWVALAAGVTGCVAGLIQPASARRAWMMIGVTALANLLFAAFYHVGDVEVFLLPVWMMLSLGAGYCATLLSQIGQRSAWTATGLPLLLLVAIALGTVGRMSYTNRRLEWQAHDLAIAMTAPEFAAGSRVIGLEGEITAIRYMQEALGRAPGLSTTVADDEELRRSELADAVATGAPVYLTRELRGIEKEYSFGGEGGLVRVWPRGQARAPEPTELLNPSANGGALWLLGYDLAPLQGLFQPTVELALYWQPQEPLTQTFKVSLRVVGPDGAQLVLSDGSDARQDLYPLRLVAPTNSWLVDETVRDVYQIPLPEGLPEGSVVEVVLYDADTQEEAGRWQIALRSEQGSPPSR